MFKGDGIVVEGVMFGIVVGITAVVFMLLFSPYGVDKDVTKRDIAETVDRSVWVDATKDNALSDEEIEGLLRVAKQVDFDITEIVTAFDEKPTKVNKVNLDIAIEDMVSELDKLK